MNHKHISAPIIFSCILCNMLATTALVSYAQATNSKYLNSSDQKILNQYIESLGKETICFDSSNIKQFWIDKTVVSKDDSIEICLNDNSESIPLKVQLANVNETIDCNILVVSDSSSLQFDILNNSMKTISSSKDGEMLLQYHVSSAQFHLEDTLDYCFYLKFKSNNTNNVSVRKIVLSFSKNKKTSFLSSPGTLHIVPDSIQNPSQCKTLEDNPKSFIVSGTKIELISSKKIYVTNNHIQTSATIKNTGNQPARIHIGYAPYTLDHNRIYQYNNPYKDGIILHVLDSKANSNQLLVDAYPAWEKGCFLALNAKEDLSDFPNSSIILNPITDIKEKDSSHAEIFLKDPLQNEIKKGTQVRIHSPHGNTYIYMNVQLLQPGEEVTLKSTIHKDNNFLAYSGWALCRGTYYVVPIFLSLSVDSSKESTILIKDFTVSY